MSECRKCRVYEDRIENLKDWVEERNKTTKYWHAQYVRACRDLEIERYGHPLPVTEEELAKIDDSIPDINAPSPVQFIFIPSVSENV